MAAEENKSLISIVKDFNDLDELLIESNGEVSEEIQAFLEINERNLATKVDNYKLYMEHCESRSAYFKRIKEQANEAQSIFKNMIERLKGNLRYAMGTLGVDELRGEMYRFKLSKARARVKILDRDALPMKYMKEVVSLEPDLEEIEKALESGEKVEGAVIDHTQGLLAYANTKGKGK